MRYRYDRIKRRLDIKRMLYRCKDTADHCYAADSEVFVSVYTIYTAYSTMYASRRMALY